MQHTTAASMGGYYGQRSQRDLYGGALGGMYSGGGGGGSGCNLGDHSDSIGQHQGFGGGLGHFGCGQQDPYNSAALDRASQVDTYINQPNLVNFMRSGRRFQRLRMRRPASCVRRSPTAPMIPSGLNNRERLEAAAMTTTEQTWGTEGWAATHSPCFRTPA